MWYNELNGFKYCLHIVKWFQVWFNINNSFWPIDETLTSISRSGQSWPESNDKYLYSPKLRDKSS